jgi:hypothetical protein
MASLVEECLTWNYDQWEGFNNPTFQEVFNKLSKKDQEEIIKQKDLFWQRTNDTISEGEAPDLLEETRKKQAEYIKKRGASFVFYESFLGALEDLDDKQFRECIVALCNYGLYQKKGDYKGVIKMYMSATIPQIDANELKRITARLNGMNGGAPNGNQNAKKSL